MPQETHPPHYTLVNKLLQAIAGYTKATGLTAVGSSTIERTKGKEPPMVVMYSSYASGDYVCWFGDQGKFHLYVLVNETAKRVMSVLANELPNLLKEAQKWDAKMKKKKS